MSKSGKNIRVIDLQAARSANYPYVRLSGGYGYTENIFDGFNRLRRQRNAQIRIENQELAIEAMRLNIQSYCYGALLTWGARRHSASRSAK